MPSRRATASRNGEAPKTATSLKRLSAATRSGLKRYPRALWECFARLEARECASPVRTEGGLADVTSHSLAAAWLGHGTVFVRVAGLNILMDPVFSERIGMSLGPITIGLNRLAPVPVAAHELPHLDLVLISHAHFDHLDKPSLRQLASKKTTVITAR